MTQEEKAKAYEMALEAARKELGVDRKEYKVVEQVLKSIFPELRESESEDERIRNCLRCLTSLDQAQDVIADMGFTRQDLLSYLEKQKEQKPNYCHYGGDPNIERCKYCSAACIGRLTEEQKPMETSDFKTKLAEYLQNNSPKDGQYVISSESILEMAKEELIKRGELQKPVEWSEEDELMRTAIIQTLERFGGRGTTGMQIDWLKSLRPGWKPTEEQMDALNKARRFIPYNCDILESLYEQLKKL